LFSAKLASGDGISENVSSHAGGFMAETFLFARENILCDVSLTRRRYISS